MVHYTVYHSIENGRIGRASLTVRLPRALLCRALALPPGESPLNAPLFRATRSPRSPCPPQAELPGATMDPDPDRVAAVTADYPTLTRALVKQLRAGKEVYEVCGAQDSWCAVVRSPVAACSRVGKPTVALNSPMAAFCDPGGICLIMSGCATTREDQLEHLRRPRVHTRSLLPPTGG